ncbi:MAG TPA: MraY family glycosyltransferase [Phycisphaerae bacterium]|nr:MraY family glycosyltransferase [Phycisphaerae bacterium]
MSVALLAAVPEWITYFYQFTSYFILFLAAVISTATATPIYILLATRLGWVDQPGGRKRHERATATMGGVVIFLVVTGGTLVALNLENLVGERLREKAAYVYGLLACTGCMVLLGMVDDRHQIRPKIKLLVQTVVAIAAVSLGFRVQAITLPGFDSVELPVAVGVLASLLWIVGITNAINLTDGLDGLAAGICFLASAVNAIVAIWLGNHYMTVMMVLLAGSLLGFLRWNFHPARVFLGDTGSLSLGMFLALASLQSAQKAHTVVLILVPLFALGYPIFDTLLAVGRRMVRGQPLFASDRDHIHHRLVDRGRSPSAAAIQIYAASVIVCVLCLAAMTAHHFVLGLIILGVILMALFSARVLGYLEWGGWAARWSGRQETKVLHAAANLARLKIAQASNPQELVRALAIIAPEIGCREIAVTVEGAETSWIEPGMLDDKGQGFEVSLSKGRKVRFTLSSDGELDVERRSLVEELAGLVGQRLSTQ